MPEFRQVDWNEIKSNLHETNFEVAEAIDNIPTKDHAPFYLASYAYGDLIFDRGTLNIYDPSDNKLKPLSECNIPQSIKDGLNYTHTMPAGFVAENSLELISSLTNRDYPYSVLKFGYPFALAAALDKNFDHNLGLCWKIYSGMKHAYMLANVSEQGRHANLEKQIGITVKAPKQAELQAHHSVFVDIAKQLNSNWQSTIILFDRKWFEKPVSVKSKLLRYELQNIVTAPSVHRWKAQYDAWFSDMTDNASFFIKPKLNSVLTFIFCSLLPGQYASYGICDSNTLLPLDLITEVYENIYEVQQAPLIMAPQSIKKNGQLHYSLNAPQLLEYPPARQNISTIMRLGDFQKAINESKELVKQSYHSNTQAMSLFKVILDTDFNYFHKGTENKKPFTAAIDIPKYDLIAKELMKKWQNLPFPANSTFFTGSVLISNTQLATKD